MSDISNVSPTVRATYDKPAIEWPTVVLALAGVGLVLFGPFFIYPIFLMKMMCFALFASSFNLMLGYTGLLSFGHAAFFGMASYVAAYSAKNLGFTPELAILSGVVTGGLLGLAFGLIAIRRMGIYFAMITLALSQMVYFIALQWPSFTGGEDGIQAVPRNHLFGLIDMRSNLAIYCLVVAVFVVGIAVIYRVVHSPFGRILVAIRDNESRATSLGYDAARYKLIAFVISASLAGLAGGTKALVFQVATLTDVHWSMSGEAILMTLVGGLGTLLGPIAGAVTIVAMQNYLSDMGSWVTIIQGFVFIFCVLVLRDGVAGFLTRMSGKLFGKRG